MNILILVGGNKNPLKPFLVEGGKLGLNVVGASFTELNYLINSDSKSFCLKSSRRIISCGYCS